MKLAATALAMLLTAAPMAYGQQAEPPATPAGGAPEAGLAGGAIVGGAIFLGVLVAVASSDNDGGAPITTAAGTATGTAP
jgi:hypothetical protein